jgi:hypothetical protein
MAGQTALRQERRDGAFEMSRSFDVIAARERGDEQYAAGDKQRANPHRRATRCRGLGPNGEVSIVAQRASADNPAKEAAEHGDVSVRRVARQTSHSGAMTAGL